MEGLLVGLVGRCPAVVQRVSGLCTVYLDDSRLPVEENQESDLVD